MTASPAVRLRGEYDGRNFDAEFLGLPVPGDVDGHSHNYELGTESLYDVAAVVGGVPEEAMLAEHREGALEVRNPIAEVRWIWTPWGPVVIPVDVQSPVEGGLFASDPERDRVLDPDAYWTHDPEGP